MRNMKTWKRNTINQKKEYINIENIVGRTEKRKKEKVENSGLQADREMLEFC